MSTLEILYWVLGLYTLWTILGCGWFLHRMGDKNGKDKLLDWILIPAVYPVAFILGLIFSRKK